MSWKHKPVERVLHPITNRRTGEKTLRTYKQLANRYRNMYLGAPPRPKLINSIKRYLWDVDLWKWASHPYYDMLLPDELLDTNRINDLYEMMQGYHVRNHIWNDAANISPDRHSERFQITRETISAIEQDAADYRTLFLLTAIARDKRSRHEYSEEMLAAQATRKLFAVFVCSRPFLYIAWKILAKCYEDYIWTPSPNGQYLDWFKVEHDDLEAEVKSYAQLIRSRGKILLPPESLVEEINHDIELHRLTDIVDYRQIRQ